MRSVAEAPRAASRRILGSRSDHFHRRRNYLAVLSAIRNHSPIPQPEVCRRTRLSHPTVASVVGELMEKGLVRCSRPGGNGVGRRPAVLEFIPDAGLIVGLDVGVESSGVVADLAGDVVIRRPACISKRRMEAADLVRVVESLLGETGDGHRLAGIGVGVAGLVDKRGGIHDLERDVAIPVRTILEDRFGVPTVVENDANVMMAAEAHTGVARGVANAVYVLKSTSGIGFGILVDGAVYRGHRGFAGENLRLVPEDVFETGTDGSVSVARPFVAGLASLIQFFDPETVVLGGDFGPLGAPFAAEVGRRVVEHGVIGRDVRIVTAEIGKEGIALGAVALGIRQVFDLT